jgi:hypothetical protein
MRRNQAYQNLNEEASGGQSWSFWLNPIATRHGTITLQMTRFTNKTDSVIEPTLLWSNPFIAVVIVCPWLTTSLAQPLANELNAE